METDSSYLSSRDKKIYNRLNVSFDLWNGESDADKYVQIVIDYLKKQGLKFGPVDVIVNEYDRNVVLKLLETPNVLNKAFDERTLNDVAEYLYQLTSVFNNFYSFNNILLEKNKNLQQSWLGLAQNVYKTNKKLLEILGIKIPKKM